MTDNTHVIHIRGGLGNQVIQVVHGICSSQELSPENIIIQFNTAKSKDAEAKSVDLQPYYLNQLFKRKQLHY